MTKNEVIAQLKAGYELVNRGTGWWLSTPTKPYTRPESIQLDDAMVKQLEDDGAIKIDLLARSLKATLAQPA